LALRGAGRSHTAAPAVGFRLAIEVVAHEDNRTLTDNECTRKPIAGPFRSGLASALIIVGVGDTTNRHFGATM
jgi:hypothetical protein